MEITRPLLEYMALKEAAQDLSQREILDRDVFVRQAQPYLASQMDKEEPRLDVSLFQLIDAFKRIMDQRLPGAKLTVRSEKWSVKEKAEIILDQLKKQGTLFFVELFGNDRTVSECIVTFLALLELVHQGLVKVFQLTMENDIRLVPAFDDKES
jgi:segregation and condensation protein A